MIPENDPFVESQDDSAGDPESIVKDLYARLNPPPFDPSVTFFAEQSRSDLGATVTSTMSVADSIDTSMMIADMRQLVDATFEHDVAMIDELRARGFMVLTSPFLEGDRIVVTLPKNFESAIRESDRRAARRHQAQQMMDLLRHRIDPRIITNLCREIELP